MLPAADTLKLLWHMVAAAGTLVVFLLFAYEVIRARSLAKAQRLAREEQAKRYVPDLAESEAPWAPKAKNGFGNAPSSRTTGFGLKPYERPMWRGTQS